MLDAIAPRCVWCNSKDEMLACLQSSLPQPRMLHCFEQRMPVCEERLVLLFEIACANEWCFHSSSHEMCWVTVDEYDIWHVLRVHVLARLDEGAVGHKHADGRRSAEELLDQH